MFRFTVSTPRSAIRPSLRHSAIFKNLSQMSYVEPEGCESSSSTVDREEALKTPVTEMITKDDEDLLTTPLNNTSVITVDSPIEEDVTPLRSRKSKAKDISIQRLTQNDESVVVLDTPESKTPKTALKTPMSVHKTNLLVGYSAIESNVASVIDSSADECSAPETDSESNELQPSKKSNRSFIEEPNSSAGSPISSTPAGNKSTKNLEESFKQTSTEDVDEESSSVLDTTTTSGSDLVIGGKRKRHSNTSTEEASRKRLKVVTVSY